MAKRTKPNPPEKIAVVTPTLPPERWNRMPGIQLELSKGQRGNSVAEIPIPESIKFAWTLVGTMSVGKNGPTHTDCEASLYAAACKCLERFLAVSPIVDIRTK